MSERPYKVEVYYEERPVFKDGYHDGLEESEKAAKESLELDESVREARILDHTGRVLEIVAKGAK